MKYKGTINHMSAWCQMKGKFNKQEERQINPCQHGVKKRQIKPYVRMVSKRDKLNHTSAWCQKGKLDHTLVWCQIKYIFN